MKLTPEEVERLSRVIPVCEENEAQKPCPDCLHDWMWSAGIGEYENTTDFEELQGEPIIACPHCGYTEMNLLAKVKQVLTGT